MTLLPYLGLHPDEVRISNSEIQGFKSCKRLWYLANYLGLQKKEQNLVGPLPLGTRVHDSLEQYYTTYENPVDAYNRLMNKDIRIFQGSIQSEDPKLVRKFESEGELGRLMLEGYIEWLAESNADANIDIQYAEKIISLSIDELGGRVILQAKVDAEARRRSDNSVAIIDHKTAADLGPYYKYSHMSEQLMTYTTISQRNPPEDGAEVDGGVYNLLKKVKRSPTAKPPFYDRIDVRFNDETLNSFYVRLLGVLTDMMEVRDKLDEGADHRFVAYPKPQMDWHCGMCPFFQLCPMMDDGSSADRYIEDHFDVINPYERYNDTTEKESSDG
jgi:hypothetical protein